MKIIMFINLDVPWIPIMPQRTQLLNNLNTFFFITIQSTSI